MIQFPDLLSFCHCNETHHYSDITRDDRDGKVYGYIQIYRLAFIVRITAPTFRQAKLRISYMRCDPSLVPSSR